MSQLHQGQDSILNLRGQLPSATISQSDFGGGGQALASILRYCSLILVLPILSFFVTKIVVLESVLGFDAGNVATNVVSAIVAVVVLHVGLGIFIYKAYFETEIKTKIGKQA